MISAPAAPFLKWPGGKRSLVSSIASHLRLGSGKYFEPFLGGGALYFHFAPKTAVLSDINSELINAYRSVRDHPSEVVRKLSMLSIAKDDYYKIRSSQPRTPLGRAVRFLYLNRTAFNGIYRVNQQGQFNVPFGCKPGTLLCDATLIYKASAVLRSASVECNDFEKSFHEARRGDTVYADPPYTTMHDNNGFRRYNETIFSWADQERLARAARKAARRGVRIAITNADHNDVKLLYPEFRQILLSRASCMAGDAKGRKRVSELLLISH